MKNLVMIMLLTALALPRSSVTQELSKTKEATAQLPLEKVLELYRQVDQLNQTQELAPPVPALVDRIDLNSRILEDRLDVQASFKIVVLDGNNWAQIALIRVDDSICFYDLPILTDAALHINEGHLSFLTRTSGTYEFTLKFLVRAHQQGRQRQARITCEQATLKNLHLEIDEHLFTLLNTPAHKERDQYILFPEGNTFLVTWRSLDSIPETKLENEPRPTIEPYISQTMASLVTTREGICLTRILHALHFEGLQTITVTLPQDQSLLKIFLNRNAIPFTVQEGMVTIPVKPSRAGDKGATLEFVLQQDIGNLYLAGHLEFRLPMIDWPINEYYLEAFLPSTYNYELDGGSLALAHKLPQLKDNFSMTIPTPGKQYIFTQSLVLSSGPIAKLAYTVDLKDKYFE
ncbi:hypothetical protein JXQ70_12590 [bacterium]|nr:hypothetical protein [bacterium]